MNPNKLVIAVNFDGTLCKDMWTYIGNPNDKLISHLCERKKEGAQLILWTCRCGDKLQDAIEWCKEQGIEFDAINDNLPDRIYKYGNNSRKIDADIYIDDKSVNPLPYRQAAGLSKLDPYNNPIDKERINNNEIL